MLVKVLTQNTSQLAQPIHRQCTLPYNLLELQLLQPRPIHLWQIRISQPAQLFMQHRQVVRSLFAQLFRMFVDDTARVDLEQAVDDEGNVFSVDNRELVCAVG
jgi:hypothetical protein